MPIQNLRGLNAWFTAQFSATIEIAVLREGAVPGPNTLRQHVKCRRPLTGVSIKDGFEDAVTETKTASQLKSVLSRFVACGGTGVRESDFIVFGERLVLNGNRNWRGKAPSPKASPKLDEIRVGQLRWVKSAEDNKVYRAVVKEITNDFIKVEYQGKYQGWTEDLPRRLMPLLPVKSTSCS